MSRRQDHKHRLDQEHGQGWHARSLVRAGAAVLAAASIGFAAPALASQPDTPSAHAATGQAHRPTTTQVNHGTTGHQHTTHTAHTAAPRTGGGSSAQAGSDVSLDKPNSFQAQADPDGLTNGGVDQPGGTGGVDTSSQDGNNGSGNDADCEDDNRGVGVPGHCKDRPATGSEGDTGTPLPVQDETSGQTSDLTPQLHLTSSLATVADTTGADSSLVSAPATGQVRGEVRTHAAAAHPATGVLPETGAGRALLGLALAALVALGLGTGLVRRGRRAAPVTG
jgi:hypothetical protein